MNEHVRLIASELHSYEADFYAWTQEQAEALRAGRLELADLENIAEEIESLGSSQRDAVISQFARATAHLLKIQFSTDEYPRRGWRVTVTDARNQIGLKFESPSLRSKSRELFEKAWSQAVRLAEAGLIDEEAALVRLVAASPFFTVEQVLDPDFFPD